MERIVPESEELYDAATPNQLDCPSSLRYDHQEAMYQIIDEVNELMMNKNFRELIEIHKYVRSQRKENSNK